MKVVAAEDAAALLANAALEEVEEHSTSVAVRLDVGLAKESWEPDHDGMIAARASRYCGRRYN